jgi:iron(III) transport system ATP-binding protein
MFMADRIALMNEGRIEQLGTPAELYLTPASRFVATFLGEVNRLPARILAGRAETPIGMLPAPPGAEEGARMEVLLRPEGLRVMPEPAPGEAPPALMAGCSAVAEVQACRLLGATTLVHLAVPDGQGGLLHLHARLPPGPWLGRGQKAAVAMDPERAFVFPAEAP